VRLELEFLKTLFWYINFSGNSEAFNIQEGIPRGGAGFSKAYAKHTHRHMLPSFAAEVSKFFRPIFQWTLGNKRYPAAQYQERRPCHAEV
jgi:hypothetical protein